MGCHLLEGLQHRCRCMGPVSEDEPAPPAGRSTLGHVRRRLAVAAVPSGRREASRGWPQRPSQQAAGGGATAFEARSCCHRCQRTRLRPGRCVGGCVASARSRVSGGDLNPDTRGALVSSRLKVVYMMCESVCVGTHMTHVRDGHGAAGPGPGPCSHAYGLVTLAGRSKPR